MKSFGYLIILVFLLFYSPVLAEEERYDYGKVWNNWTDLHRYIYLWGFEDGMSEGWNDLERFFHKTLQKDWSPYVEEHMAFYIRSISKNFPNIIEVRDVMTSFYVRPANSYLEPRIVLLASVAKIRGSSPELIEELLAMAREKSGQLRMMREKETISTEEVKKYIEGPSFSSLVYKEIYGEQD